MRKTVALGCLCVLSLITPIPALGQAVYGNVMGTVVAPSGAAVPNAKVIISDTSRAVTFNTTKNESGFFTQRFLIAGTYQVRVEASSFRAYVQDVSVSVDQETSLDIKLQLGELSEAVEPTR